MRLQDVSGIAGFDVLRDGEFRSLGVLSHKEDALLVQLYDKNYIAHMQENPHISCVITNRELARYVPEEVGLGVCEDPSVAFYKVHEYLYHKTNFYWESFKSEISSEVNIHKNAYVAPNNVRVGHGTIIEANAAILEGSIIGENTIIRAGCIIGGEGYEPKWVAGRHIMIPHAGGVLIGDRVEIQSNSHVARSLFGEFTKIGNDTKIDALVHIGHKVTIGQHCEIAAGVVIAGSVVIGHNVWIGPNATISSEVCIEDNAFVTIGSVVTMSVAKGQRVTGNFAIDHSKFLNALLRNIR